MHFPTHSPGFVKQKGGNVMYNNGQLYTNWNRYNPNFNNYGQSYYGYGQNYPQMQQQSQEQVPFQAIRFLNVDEIKGWAVQPNTTEMLIDRANKQVTIKSADMMGESSSKTYKYEPVGENSTEHKESEIDPKDYATKGDLDNFITKDQLDALNKRLDVLTLKIKAEGDNGKQ